MPRKDDKDECPIEEVENCPFALCAHDIKRDIKDIKAGLIEVRNAQKEIHKKIFGNGNVDCLAFEVSRNTAARIIGSKLLWMLIGALTLGTVATISTIIYWAIESGALKR